MSIFVCGRHFVPNDYIQRGDVLRRATSATSAIDHGSRGCLYEVTLAETVVITVPVAAEVIVNKRASEDHMGERKVYGGRSMADQKALNGGRSHV